MFTLFLCVCTTAGAERILFSGLDGWTHEKVEKQYNMYRSYSSMGIIDSSSILAYYLDDTGGLGRFQTIDETTTGEMFQKKIKYNLGLKAYPCLYCDATIGGPCTNLTDRLEKVYARKKEFIVDSINLAHKNGWDGYSVDFEPDGPVNSTTLTDFMMDWTTALNANGLTLYVWIGGPTSYDMNRIFEGPKGMKLLTMSTYYATLHTIFIQMASYSIENINYLSRLGFGLLTYSNGAMHDYNRNFSWPNDNDETDKNIMWAANLNLTTYGLWASYIPPAWYVPLKNIR